MRRVEDKRYFHSPLLGYTDVECRLHAIPGATARGLHAIACLCCYAVD